jgi:uncharacterized protein (DUF433 family)
VSEQVDVQAIARQVAMLELDLERLHRSFQTFIRPTMTSQATQYPYVECEPEVLGGEPVIRGTRTPVRAVVEHWKFGDSPEEILRHLPHLRLAEVFDALSYYDDHRDEIERYIALNRVPVDD